MDAKENTFFLISIHNTLQKRFYQIALLILMHISYSSLIQLFQATERHYIRHGWGPKMLITCNKKACPLIQEFY